MISTYGLIAITKEGDKYYLVMLARESEDKSIFGNLVDSEPGTEYGRVPLHGSKITLKARGNFINGKDEGEFYYLNEMKWEKLGVTHSMVWKMDQFIGCRFGLFLFSTKEFGGCAEFSNFKYNIIR